MHGWAARIDLTAIARNGRIHPAVIHIAVEYLGPCSTQRKAKVVTPPCVFPQIYGNHHVSAYTWQPAMKGNHAIIVVDMKHVDRIAAKSWMRASHSKKLTYESEVIGHYLVGT